MQYKYQVNKYVEQQGITYEELIKEAEYDEENITKISKRRIAKRLTQYQLHMKKRGLQNTTIINNLSLIKSVYRYEDIQIPKLRNLKKIHHETYKDIPTSEEITYAIANSRTKMKAIITFIASSGLRRSDVANITIKDFIDATSEYHNTNDIYEVIKQLENKKNIIPTWEITTKKTNVDHITFSSPESTIFTIQLLKERIKKLHPLNNDTKLFGLTGKGITTNFCRTNDRLNFGWNTTRRKFHPHSLRTFFGTTLTTNGMDYLSTEFLIGHKLSSVNQSYYYANPEKLKNKYARYVDKLTFTMNVDYVSISDKEKRELEMLRRENNETKKRLLKLEELVDLMNNNLE